MRYEAGRDVYSVSGCYRVVIVRFVVVLRLVQVRYKIDLGLL